MLNREYLEPKIHKCWKQHCQNLETESKINSLKSIQKIFPTVIHILFYLWRHSTLFFLLLIIHYHYNINQKTLNKSILEGTAYSRNWKKRYFKIIFDFYNSAHTTLQMLYQISSNDCVQLCDIKVKKYNQHFSTGCNSPKYLPSSLSHRTHAFISRKYGFSKINTLLFLTWLSWIYKLRYIHQWILEVLNFKRLQSKRKCQYRTQFLQ